MKYNIVKNDDLEVCGVSIELTTSQSKNSVIIGNHWKKFNVELKKKNIKLGKDWVKYGITKKMNGKYYYMPAIPTQTSCASFELEVIPAGSYACFTHRGNMALMKSAYHKIYKNIIPESDLDVNNQREMIHYERYDFRFNWNSPDSIIDIYVPITNIALQ